MQEKLIRILKKIVVKVIGVNGDKIIDILYKKQKVNEFSISEKLSLTINQTRNILYKLADAGLVGFIRKKDKKKGGWYIYFWTLKTKKVIQKAQEETISEIERLKKEVEARKKERYYYSKSIDVEYTEEEALQNNFICPETGEVLELRDTSQIQESAMKEIKKHEDALEEINKELIEIEESEKKMNEKKMREEKINKINIRKEKKRIKDKLENKKVKVENKKVKVKILKRTEKTKNKPKKKK